MKSYSRPPKKALRSYLPAQIVHQAKSIMKPSKRRTPILARRRNSRSTGRTCARSETNNSKMSLLRSRKSNSVKRKRRRSERSSIRNRRR